MNPYQSPSEVHDERISHGVFRTKYLPTFVLLFVVIHVVLILTFSIDFVASKQVPDSSAMIGILGIMFFIEVVMTVWITHLFRVYVNEDGIRCFDFWGKYHDVAWSEVKESRPAWFLWLPYLRLYSESRPPIWLPLFLHRQRELWNCIRAWAPNGAIRDVAMQRLQVLEVTQ